MKTNFNQQRATRSRRHPERLRLARGLTLEDLSRIAGVSKSMLSQIEREKANPTIAITWRLANALGVQIGELLSSEVRPTELIRLVDAHEIPTLPGAHAGYRCASLGRWSWPASTNGMR